jgi:putative peptidoglycan lipid II flippase
MSARAGAQIGLAALLLAASQLLSRLLGLARDMAIAGLIGRGAETGAYNAAFQIPDLMFHLLAGGALSIAFIPLYQRACTQRGAAGGERFLADVLGTISVLAAAATALLFVFAEPLVALQFPKFSAADQALTVRLTRIVLPAQLAFIAGGVLRGALMAEGRFLSQALAPLIYNLGIIVVGVALHRRLGVEAFAWGALVGAWAGSLGSALHEARGRLRIGFRVALGDADFRRYLVVALPLMLGVTLVTADEWYGRWFGGVLGTTAIATLVFARRIMQVPVGLVGQAVATASLPAFSKLVEQGSPELGRVVLRSLQASLAVAVLFAAATAAFAEPIVRLVYVRGAFSLADAALVTEALRIFCLAIPGWIVQTLAVRPFYARAAMWTPMWIGTAVALAAIPLYLWLGRTLGIGGLALAGGLAISANALATVIVARLVHGAPRLWPLLGTLVRSLVCAAPAAALGWLVADIAVVRSGLVGFAGALYQLAVGGAVYAALALPLALLLGDVPTRDTLRALLRRVLRRR